MIKQFLAAVMLLVLATSVSASVTLACNNTGVYFHSTNKEIICWTDVNSTIIFDGTVMTRINETHHNLSVQAGSLTGYPGFCNVALNVSAVAATVDNTSITDTFYVDGLTVYPCVESNTTGVEPSIVSDNIVDLLFMGYPVKVDTLLHEVLVELTEKTFGSVIVSTNLGNVNISMGLIAYNDTHGQCAYTSVLNEDTRTIRVMDADYVRSDPPYAALGTATAIVVLGLAGAYKLAAGKRR